MSAIADGLYASLRLDGAGHPRIAYLDAAGPNLAYAVNDGAAWSSQVVDASSRDAGTILDRVALALDAQDRPHIAYSLTIVRGEASLELMAFALLDATGWRYSIVDRRNSGFDTAIALDQSGFPWITYRRGLPREKASLRAAHLALPDLRGALSAATVTGDPQGFSVRADLSVTNAGTMVSRGFSVAYYLSTDDLYDAGDTPLGKAVKTGALGAGRSRTLHLAERVGVSPSGRHVIAVIDAASVVDEIGEGNNAAATLVP